MEQILVHIRTMSPTECIILLGFALIGAFLVIAKIGKVAHSAVLKRRDSGPNSLWYLKTENERLLYELLSLKKEKETNEKFFASLKKQLGERLP